VRFKRNKYRSWYKSIIANAKTAARIKQKGGPCFERHHILPKSMGGSDKPCNLVLLTAKEHFLCHWLLTQFTIGTARRSAAFAFGCMTMRPSGTERLTSAQYSKLISAKREAAISVGGPSLDACRKGGLAMKGYKHQPEFGRSLSISQRGKVLTKEHREKISASRKRSDRVKRSLERLHSDPAIAQKKRASMMITSSTDEGKMRRVVLMQARALAGYPKNHKCEHCGNFFTKSRYTALHGQKCKMVGAA